jgi:YHS domain-containing protein
MEGHAAMDMSVKATGTLWSRLSSPEGFTSVAHGFVMEWAAVLRDIVIGLFLAGALGAWVPDSFWRHLFFTGHPLVARIWGPLIGPIISVFSFVCSIGNVPLAAVLWNGGISFGGVISFIFADLIAFPLVVIYRKFYGTRLTMRLFFLFYAVMAAAGLAVEGIFSAAGLIPKTRPRMIVATSFHWNYTAVLNIIFLLVFAVLYWLYRNRNRLGGAQRYAIDPVCGMQVERANAPAEALHAGQMYFFCSDRCHERFEANPARYASPGAEPEGMEGEPAATVDPVCGMTVDPSSAAAHRSFDGFDYWFCSVGCAEAFDADPNAYVAKERAH